LKKSQLDTNNITNKYNKAHSNWTLSWAKKVLKLYKAMTYFEKMKHLEPNMSKAYKEFAKILYNEVKEGGSNSIERSANNTSAGLMDGISINSQGFQFSDEHSI
jgi:hypothetical protein